VTKVKKVHTVIKKVQKKQNVDRVSSPSVLNDSSSSERVASTGIQNSVVNRPLSRTNSSSQIPTQSTANRSTSGNKSASTEKRQLSTTEIAVDDEDDAVDSQQKLRLRQILSAVKNKKQKRDELENTQRDIQQKLESLKKEVHEWMETTETDTLKWEGHGFNKKEKVQIPRVTVGDVLEIVREKYGEESMDRVIDEVDKRHTELNANKYELKLVSKNSTKKKVVEPSTSKKKQKTSLEL
jgi:hypothetical protein